MVRSNQMVTHLAGEAPGARHLRLVLQHHVLQLLAVLGIDRLDLQLMYSA